LIAFERDRQGLFTGNDPAPERSAARVLAAFILSGLVFLALPGTLLGVWNLLSIAEQRSSSGAKTAWIQAHGQAQLFGWVGTFILGISLYVLPKFLGRSLRRFDLAWTVWVLWTVGAGWRWWIGVGGPAWRFGLVGSAVLELAAFALSQYLLWYVPRVGPAGPEKRQFPGDLASWLGVVGFGAFGIALMLNLWIAIPLARAAAGPVVPPVINRVFLVIALWGFVIPVAWGYSTRFVTVFAGLEKPAQTAARWLAAAVAGIVLCALFRQFLVADILALATSAGAIWTLRVFLPSVREPKRAGVYRDYPIFIRLAYLWLVVGAILGVWADLAPALAGMGGASRHALTVGFLSTLIFCVGPLILPSFLSGRELRSIWLMGISLWFLNIGCLLRVSSEAAAYSAGGISWSILPLSALIELTAVLAFTLNMVMTFVQRIPAWFGPGGVSGNLPVYFYVTSFPPTRNLLVGAGLRTLGIAKQIPRSLSLEEAAAADGADIENILGVLRKFVEQRQPRRSGRK
jgi:hypothetical protein